MLCLAVPEDAGIHDGESWVREWVMIEYDLKGIKAEDFQPRRQRGSCT